MKPLSKFRPNRWAVFISGNGSNLNALLDIRPEADIALVLSNSKQAYGLLRARRAGVPTVTLSHPLDWKEINGLLQRHRIDCLFLAGFMKLIPADFLSNWKGQIWNVHPSLLPDYPGLKSIKRAHDDGAALGVTVHGVIPEVDAGPHLLRRRVETWGRRSLETSEFLVHLSEHRLVRESVKRCKNVAM